MGKLAAFAVAVVSGLALAAAIALRGWTTPKSPPPALSCEALARARDANEDDPQVEKARAIERPVARQMFLATGREVSVRFVLLDDAPLRSAAMACSDGQAYVTRALLDRVLTAGDDAMLALVIGHELAHLRFDFESSWTAVGEPPVARELAQIRADQYGAFLATLAGFRLEPLARGDALARFLAETDDAGALYGVAGGAASAARRQAALAETIATFDWLEQVYRAGFVVAIAGFDEEAAHVFADLDREGLSLVPEVKLARALVALEEVRRGGPWLDRFAFAAEAGEGLLSCRAAFAAETSLSGRATKGAGSRRADVNAALDRARVLFADAEKLGGRTAPIELGRACAAIYAGELEGADQLLGGADVPLLHELVEENRALVAFLRAVRERPPPSRAEPEKLASWAGAIPPEARGHAGVRVLIEQLSGAPPPALPVVQPSSFDFASLFEHAPLCAPGWVDTTPPMIRSMRARSCARGNETLLELGFAKATLVLHTLEPPPQELRTLEAWQASCGRIRAGGAKTFTTSCPDRGLTFAALFTEGEAVARAVSVDVR